MIHGVWTIPLNLKVISIHGQLATVNNVELMIHYFIQKDVQLLVISPVMAEDVILL